MAELSLNSLQAWIGKSQCSFSELPPFNAQALAGAIKHHNSPEPGDHLPLPWHWLYFLDPTRRDRTGEDGHPLKGGFLPPVPLPRRMWAAGALEIAQPLVLGQATEKVSTITSVEAKEGRSGPLVFVNLNHELSQGGNLCITEEQNLVYREAPRERTELPPGVNATQTPEFSKEVIPDPVLLFRYSALTYNGHRIHYDRDYAVNTELYPALVVHGPLRDPVTTAGLREHSRRPGQCLQFSGGEANFRHSSPHPLRHTRWQPDSALVDRPRRLHLHESRGDNRQREIV